ncbi:ALF repeat-containing protein [Saccharopolyspora sp. NPDC050389]|uniref:ALF repeat-containing protein n=1 Tax=Saccharopolyspora sp. NPDC050389 TaxID=3155516 RepID=UPI0033DFE792
MREAAEAALNGAPEDVRRFLAQGQFTAREHRHADRCGVHKGRWPRAQAAATAALLPRCVAATWCTDPACVPGPGQLRALSRPVSDQGRTGSLTLGRRRRRPMSTGCDPRHRSRTEVGHGRFEGARGRADAHRRCALARWARLVQRHLHARGLLGGGGRFAAAE